MEQLISPNPLFILYGHPLRECGDTQPYRLCNYE